MPDWTHVGESGNSNAEVKFMRRDVVSPVLADDSMSVVVRGLHNPGALSPDWALRHGVISDREYMNSQVTQVTPELSVFELGWLQVICTRDSLQFTTTSEEEFERLRDSASIALRALEDTPLIALGINRAVTFAVESVDDWHYIGDSLAPKEHWSDILQLPGTQSVSILAERTDGEAGRVAVEVRPSSDKPNSVVVSVNDHFELRPAEQIAQDRSDFLVRSAAEEVDMDLIQRQLIPRRQRALRILSELWVDSFTRSEAVIDRVSSIPRSRR